MPKPFIALKIKHCNKSFKNVLTGTVVGDFHSKKRSNFSMTMMTMAMTLIIF